MPPAQRGACVAPREEVLEVSPLPDDPPIPMVCMDAPPVPWLQEGRKPRPAAAGQPARDDSESERHGTANLFLVTAPLRGGRTVRVRAHKTARDWAPARPQLLDTPSPEAARLRLVGDHRNTPGMGSLSAAFPPAPARGRAARLEIHQTPKHGRWLHRAERELSALTRPCLDRRLPDLETLIKETTPWETRRHASHKGVDGPCSTPEASIKLQRLYPQMQS